MRFHPNQTKHQQAMRMSKFSIELLLGVSVKISHQQIGSISTLLFECLVFLFRSPNIQIAFFFSDNDFCIWFIMLCQSEFRSSRSYSLDLFGTVLLTVTVISFGDPKLSDMTTSMKVIVFVTATHLSATKEDCEKHVDTD